MSDVLFGENKSHWGSGVYAEDVEADILRCDFIDNQAHNSGGGFYADTGSNVKIGRSNFKNNKATWGGGVYSSESSDLTIMNSQFDGNSAVEENYTGGDGGAIDCEKDSSLILLNCLLTNNNAEESGGAVLLEENSNSEIINSTFSGNLAYAGSAISSYSSTSLVKNSIIFRK